MIKLWPLLLIVLLAPQGYTNAQIRGLKGKKPIKTTISGKKTILYQKSYALVIGVSDYTNGWPDLPGVKKDIAVVKQILEEHDFEVFVAEDLDSEQLRQEIEKFIYDFGIKDFHSRLLIYFAGHGATIHSPHDPEQKMGYIVPADAPPPERDLPLFIIKAMDMGQIELYATQKILTKHVLFVFDSCFSGTIFAVHRDPPRNIIEKTEKQVRQFITSGSAEESVPDESIFRRKFVAALKGEGDTNNDGYVTGNELGEFLRSQVINYSQGSQHPQYGKVKYHPKLAEGDFVFVVAGKEPMKMAKAPIRVRILTRRFEDQSWRPAKMLVSRWFYRFEMRAERPVYVYGYQIDSSNAILSIYPRPPQQIPAAYQYSLPNPIVPGVHEFPPDKKVGFQLDDVTGKERFCFVYSEEPLDNPRQLLEQHLAGKLYPFIVEHIVEHR